MNAHFAWGPNTPFDASNRALHTMAAASSGSWEDASVLTFTNMPPSATTFTHDHS